MTRSVAKSSRSPNLLPILSPAPPPARSAGGTYDPFFMPAACAAVAGSSPIPAATSADGVSPTGAMVSLYGHRAVKCSPLQMRHLTFLSRSWSFMACALGSVFSSLASLRQLVLGRKMMFSPTDVVSATGVRGSFALSPNFAHVLRSATRGFTRSVCVVYRTRRVVFTFWPFSLMWYVMMVLVPSLLLSVCEGGSSVLSSSMSSSSAQSCLLLWCVSMGLGRGSGARGGGTHFVLVAMMGGVVAVSCFGGVFVGSEGAESIGRGGSLRLLGVSRGMVLIAGVDFKVPEFRTFRVALRDRTSFCGGAHDGGGVSSAKSHILWHGQKPRVARRIHKHRSFK